MISKQMIKNAKELNIRETLVTSKRIYIKIDRDEVKYDKMLESFTCTCQAQIWNLPMCKHKIAVILKVEGIPKSLKEAVWDVENE